MYPFPREPPRKPTGFQSWGEQSWKGQGFPQKTAEVDFSFKVKTWSFEVILSKIIAQREKSIVHNGC